MKKKIFNISLSLLTVITCFGNNISVSNTKLMNKNHTDHTVLVNFDIAWENSWRTSSGPSNWDAAWIFIKYSIKNANDWHHATLNWVDGSGANDGHVIPTSATIKSSNDNGSGGASGVFLYRSSDMVQGNVSYTGTKLKWNYGVDGITDIDDLDFCVYAIEMVYVPQASFYLGDGNGIVNANSTFTFYTYPSIVTPYQVNSESAINVGTTNGDLFYPNTPSGFGNYPGDQVGPIPANYPKGYDAFYCMKHEVTQQQYVDFLNKLTTVQATNRAYTGGTNRNGITGTPGNYSTTFPLVACNFLSTTDLMAYLDWSAIRPMSELEFEKACRGTLLPVGREFAWGRAGNAPPDVYYPTGLANSGLANESPTPSPSNCASAYNLGGPIRVGSLAQPGNDRVLSGATYYGILDMSGNVQERVINASTPEGRAFTGNHGNGMVGVSGDHDVTNWPPAYVGVSCKGGAAGQAGNMMNISYRTDVNQAVSTRHKFYGGRGVRTAP